MIFKKTYSLLFLLLLFPAFASEAVSGPQASAPQTGPQIKDIAKEPDLPSLITIAFRNNPRLKAARLRWEAVVEKYPQVTAYEDPVLKYTRFIKKAETRVGPQNQGLSFSQKIPFPGKLSLKGEIVAKEARMARLDFEGDTRDLIVDLKDAWYELLYITNAIRITRENQKLATLLSKIGETDYSMDGTTLNDVLKAQSQLAQLSYDLILLTELKEVEIARINAILNRPPEAPLGDPKGLGIVPFKHSLKKLYELAVANQQEIGKAAAKIERNEKAVDLARMDYYPNFILGFQSIDIGEAVQSAGGTRPADSGKNAFEVNFGVTLPIWLGKNRSRVAEARLRHEGAIHEKKDLENRTFAGIKSVFFKIRNSRRLIDLYRVSLIPQAQQSLEAAETWYKEKRGSFSGLLEARTVWLNFNLALFRAQTDYNQHIARMEKLVGVSLGMGGPQEKK